MNIDRSVSNAHQRPLRKTAETVRSAITAAAALFVIANPTGSMAAPHCMTRILADVAAEEAPEQVKSKANGDFGPVTRIKVNRSTGKMVYCAEGSYCYDSNAFEFTTPCRLKLDKEKYFGDYFTYFTR